MTRLKFDLSLLPDHPDLMFEQLLWQKGVQYIAGVDEAGRGALAGPVCTGAVVLPSGNSKLAVQLAGVRDSKQMTTQQRDTWAEVIKSIATTWAVGWASSEEIDRLGIAPATRLAAKRAVEMLKTYPQHLLVDYIRLPEIPLPQTSLVKGDRRALSIACASVLAKTARDALMQTMAEQYPGYGFEQHKGYGTRLHQSFITTLGPCTIHRRSFHLDGSGRQEQLVTSKASETEAGKAD